MLLWLDPSQLIYCDTDSLIFRYDPDNPKHKCPKKDERDIPDNVRFGDALGGMGKRIRGRRVDRRDSGRGATATEPTKVKQSSSKRV